jgi:phosphate transporter
MHSVVELALPFTPSSKSNLNDAIARLLALYGTCVTRGDTTVAKQQLKLYQREHIALERDTVWRLMIGRARRGEAGLVNGNGGIETGGATLVVDVGDEQEGVLVQVRTPAGIFRLTRRELAVMCAVAVFAVMLNVRIVDGVEANRCLGILVFCTILWATEVTRFLCPISHPDTFYVSRQSRCS